MLAFLIIAALFGIGFGLGYGIRDLISRRRHSRLQHSDLFARQTPERDKQAEDAARVFVESLNRVLGAADDRIARHQHPPGRQRVDRGDDLEIAVRDLLVQFSRRTSHRPRLRVIHRRR
jgi:hypothetical protein